MKPDERETAELAVMHLYNAIVQLKKAHQYCETLMSDYGWDIDPWDMSKAAMDAGENALAIVDCIADNDKWNHHLTKNQKRRNQ